MINDAAAGKNSVVFGTITTIAIVLCCIGIGFLIFVPIYNWIRDVFIKKWRNQIQNRNRIGRDANAITVFSREKDRSERGGKRQPSIEKKACL